MSPVIQLFLKIFETILKNLVQARQLVDKIKLSQKLTNERRLG